jgi:hypothetical protein
VVAREQLEPGDRLLMYSDGITEARDEHGAFFGEDRLVELTEQAAAAEISAPETLRRLAVAVLDHQRGAAPGRRHPAAGRVVAHRPPARAPDALARPSPRAGRDLSRRARRG